MEVDGAGSTTVWTYLIPLNCTLKNGHYNSKSYVLPQQKKWEIN